MNRNLLRDILSAGLVFLTFFVGYAQNTISPSINAASQAVMNTGGEPRVNHSTGIMSYGIPLFIHKDGGANFGIDLTYIATGIKAEQQASSVGIGWNLSATGVIARQVRGLPDETLGKGRLILPHPSPGLPGYEAIFFSSLDRGLRDGEADIFTLQYGSLHVDFFLNVENPGTYPTQYVAIPLKRSNVKINVVMGDLLDIAGFDVVDESGNRYSFMEKEYVFGYTEGTSSSYAQGTGSFIGSWYLTELETYSGEKVAFEYASDLFSAYVIRHQENELFYGNPWVVFGEDQQLRSEYIQLVNQATTDAVRRGELLDHLYSLDEGQDYYLRKLYEAAIASNQQNYISEVSKINNFAVNVPGQVMEGYATQLSMINLQKSIYESQLFNLGAPITHTYLESKLMELANTGTYKSSKMIFQPTVSNTSVKLVRKIYLRDASFEFTYKAVSTAQKPRSLLDTIKKYDLNNNIIQSAVFEYNQGATTAGVRPFLKAVRFLGASGPEDDDPIIRFDYFDEDSIFDEKSQDYWGFYNGVAAGENYIPDLSGVTIPVAEVNAYMSKHVVLLTNRYTLYPSAIGQNVRSFDCNGAFAKIHSLKNVYLPTGGGFEFDYEGNTVSPLPGYSPELGGIRIKSIKSVDLTGEVSSKKFKYDFYRNGFTNKESTGFYVKRNYVTNALALRYEYNSTPPDAFVSSQLFDMGFQFRDAGNEDVFYSYVEEEISGNGRVGYEFLEFQPRDSIYPYWLESLPLSKTIYDAHGKLVEMERFKYQGDINDVVPFLKDVNYADRFIQNSTHAFTGYVKQYKPFPFRLLLDTDPNHYSTSTDHRTFFNAYSMVYAPNIVPRSNPRVDSLVYGLRYGGSILLAETERWAAAETGVFLMPQQGEAKYSHRLLYEDFNFPGIAEVQTFTYANPLYRSPTKTALLLPDGTKFATKIKRPLDYAIEVAPFIDSLRSHNRLLEPIERQKWVLEAGASQWKIVEGDHMEYSHKPLSAEDGHRARQAMMPKRLYKLYLETPVLAGEQGWQENFNATPPYGATHLGNALYEADQEYFWVSGYKGIRLSGTRPIGGLSSKAIAEDYREHVEVLGADPDEVLKLPTLNGLKVKTLLTDFTQFGYNDQYGGYLNFVKDFQERIRQTGFNPNNTVFPHDILSELDTVLNMVIHKNFTEKYKDKVYETYLMLSLIFPDLSKQFQLSTFCSPHTSFEEIFQILTLLLSFAQNSDFSMFTSNELITPNGKITARMPLAKYLASGKRLEFNSVDNISSKNVRITYNDGTPPLSVTVSFTLQDKGFRTGYLNLDDLSNASHVKDLEMDVISTNNTVLFVVPEGSAFTLKQFDNNGSLIRESDSRGAVFNYQYDGHGRLKRVYDKEGNIIQHTDYHIVNSPSNTPNP